MNYEEIYTKLISVVNALNSIETHGRNNLLNLGGAINIIEEVARTISEAARPAPEDGK